MSLRIELVKPDVAKMPAQYPDRDVGVSTQRTDTATSANIGVKEGVRPALDL